MKIYLCYVGEYSDRRVIAVCISKEMAEKFLIIDTLLKGSFEKVAYYGKSYTSLEYNMFKEYDIQTEIIDSGGRTLIRNKFVNIKDVIPCLDIEEFELLDNKRDEKNEE